MATSVKIFPDYDIYAQVGLGTSIQATAYETQTVVCSRAARHQSIDASQLNAATATITGLTSHLLLTGDPLMLWNNTPSQLPGLNTPNWLPLVNGASQDKLPDLEPLWARKLSSSSISLHFTQAGAIANTDLVPFSNSGSFTHWVRMAMPVNALIGPLHRFWPSKTFTGGKIIRVSRNAIIGDTYLHCSQMTADMAAADESEPWTEPIFNADFTFDVVDDTKAEIVDERTYTGGNLWIVGTPPNNAKRLKGLAAGTTTFTFTHNGATSPAKTVVVEDPAGTPLAVIEESDYSVRKFEVARVTADASRNMATPDKRVGMVIDWDDGDTTQDLRSAVHCYKTTGVKNVELTVYNNSGTSDTDDLNITVTEWPAATTTITLGTTPGYANNWTGFLAAWNSWTGDERHIIIPKGTVLTSPDGDEDLPAKRFGNSNWLTIKSTGTLPAVGTRMDGDNAGHLSEVATFTPANLQQFAMNVSKNTDNVMFEGIEWRPKYQHRSLGQSSAFTFGIGKPSEQTSYAENPTNIILKHCLLRPDDDVDVLHGVLNDGYRTTFIDCDISNFKATPGAGDTQAIFSNNAKGDHVYDNCRIEGGSENVIYGGDTPSIPYGIASTVEWRRCLFTKNPDWYVDTTIGVKNIFESKCGRRFYFEGCIFENHWDTGSSQFFAIVLKSSVSPGSEGNFAVHAVSEEMVFDNNIVRHVFGFFTGSIDRYYLFDGPAGDLEWEGLKPNRLTFRNLLVDDHSRAWRFPGGGGPAKSFMFLNQTERLTLDHVTHIIPDDQSVSGQAINGWYGVSVNCYNLVAKNSIFHLGLSGFGGEGVGGGFQVMNTTSGSVTDEANSKAATATWTFNKNVGIRGGGWLGFQMPNSGPDVNTYVADYTDVDFVNYAGGNYTPDTGSPADNYATDGMDSGALISTLNTRTANTVSGTGWSGGGAPAEEAPVASSVAITGTKTVGQTLTRTYSYSDANGDPEGTSTTKWYRSDTGVGAGTFITGATGSTYVLQAGDEGKYIRVGVIPVASSGTSPGTEAFSSYTTAIAGSGGGGGAPTPTAAVRGKVKIRGKAKFR